MGEKLVIGPINKGLRTDRTAFNIDNDSFPTLINAYQWRGRVKRKRGTEFLCRLQRYFNSTNTSYSSFETFSLVFGSGNLFSGFNLQSTGNIVPGSVTINDVTLPTTFTDNGMGVLVGGSGGTINYSTGSITITGGGTDSINAEFNYYPGLPVLGIEDFVVKTNAFPGTIAFDNKYSYNISPINFSVSDVSFYNNPSTGTYSGYVQKTDWTPTSWNGQDYQQFDTVNYQGAFWATNGINIPFDATNIGMQFSPSSDISAVTVLSATTIQMTIANCPLVIGDFVFLNEWTDSTTPENGKFINFQTGYVTACSPNTPPLASKTVTITIPNTTFVFPTPDTYVPGIVQYLTTRRDVTKDCLRWYNGSPVTGNPPTFINNLGWVNFCPPLSNFSYSISDEPQAVYYLVGARLIVPFKDRLLFMGPVIQTSAADTQVYLQDTVIYSQNGTPYYTCSFSGDPVFVDTEFFPILVPENQTATSPAWFEDQVGFGGFISAGVDHPIVTAEFNEDVIITGFSNFQSRLAYTGNDIVPFNFFSINTEYGSSSTFSAITTDQGVLTRSSRGYVMTGQTSCQRFDLEIPDEVFELNLNDNGSERFCAARDFINEWIYFTYPSASQDLVYPNQTLQFNYRDNSWAIINESYTTYGSFTKQSGDTWETLEYDSWTEWNDPWNAGETTSFQPIVLGGNQQGFILQKGVGTGEGISLSIQGFTGNIVTCLNHNLNENDYIIITGCIGTISTEVNGFTFKIGNVTTNSFSLNPSIGSGTYSGGGVITRIYIPVIQTKQFPVSWDSGRKTRLGPQLYLLSSTYNSEITLLIFLSQNSSSPYNIGDIYPDPNAINNGLIYTTVLYTCPESTNLGLTPANTNLQMPTAAQQDQIWHRINTSLLGDTVQLGFTLSDAQVRDTFISGVISPITSASQTNPCLLGCTAKFQVGTIIQISGVLGMVELNGNNYQVISSTPTNITIDVDATSFDAYISGGISTPLAGTNAFSEIELHSIVMDLSPSQVLA